MTPADLGPRSLRAAYRDGLCEPEEVIDEVYRRIGERGDDGVWITVVPHARAREAARGLDPARRDELPLFGVPFSVKDNIDVAGFDTTAACPAFGYRPESSAALVDALEAAGAILVGKTNLDQFATGLSGVRSPFGIPASAGDPELIAGGSSSGAAVSVAAGLVGFAIGTDTAGSGRVPAALNGIVGIKPSIGLVSTRGIVPACRTLDCPSVFASTVADAASVLAVVAGYDAADPASRGLRQPAPAPRLIPLQGLRLGVPRAIARWGDRGEHPAWEALCARLVDAGAEVVPLDLDPLLEAGDLLYAGPWVADRLSGLADFVDARPEEILAVTREILTGGLATTGVEVFDGIARLRVLRRQTAQLLEQVDALITPTVTETFTIAEMIADPVVLNNRLGTFTTFTNLLDLCAVAVPSGGERAPFGVSVQAGAGRDDLVAGIAAQLESLPVDLSR